jgi:hypothetical protein
MSKDLDLKHPALLKYWREDHPGQPDPDDAGMRQWLIETERKTLKEEWLHAHPGHPLPDDYAVVRRWYINWRNERIIEFARDFGGTFH